MGYCSRIDVQNVIAQALTSATASTTDSLGSYSSLLNIGNSFDKNMITNSIVDYYIQMADREIDGRLTNLYVTPFCETANFETVLFSDIYEYNSYIITERVCPLQIGDEVILIYEDNEERHTIIDIVSSTVFETEEPILFNFPADSRIVRVSYPDPIRFISARYAAATIYDKYFAAESSPNASKFGEQIRTLGDNDIQNILDGVTILHGIHRIGRRFYNSNLVDQYGLSEKTNASNKK
ncbi:MAG: hypothetical protein WC942_11090 [Clostridia bacterium]|jgi:hypothetical protein